MRVRAVGDNAPRLRPALADGACAMRPCHGRSVSSRLPDCLRVAQGCVFRAIARVGSRRLLKNRLTVHPSVAMLGSTLRSAPFRRPAAPPCPPLPA
jgi:hypothetical protein